MPAEINDIGYLGEREGEKEGKQNNQRKTKMIKNIIKMWKEEIMRQLNNDKKFFPLQKPDDHYNDSTDSFEEDCMITLAENKHLGLYFPARTAENSPRSKIVIFQITEEMIEKYPTLRPILTPVTSTNASVYIIEPLFLNTPSTSSAEQTNNPPVEKQVYTAKNTTNTAEQRIYDTPKEKSPTNQIYNTPIMEKHTGEHAENLPTKQIYNTPSMEKHTGGDTEYEKLEHLSVQCNNYVIYGNSIEKQKVSIEASLEAFEQYISSSLKIFPFTSELTIDKNKGTINNMAGREFIEYIANMMPSS